MDASRLILNTKVSILENVINEKAQPTFIVQSEYVFTVENFVIITFFPFVFKQTFCVLQWIKHIN